MTTTYYISSIFLLLDGGKPTSNQHQALFEDAIYSTDVMNVWLNLVYNYAVNNNVFQLLTTPPG